MEISETAIPMVGDLHRAIRTERWLVVKGEFDSNAGGEVTAQHLIGHECLPTSLVVSARRESDSETISSVSIVIIQCLVNKKFTEDS